MPSVGVTAVPQVLGVVALIFLAAFAVVVYKATRPSLAMREGLKTKPLDLGKDLNKKATNAVGGK